MYVHMYDGKKIVGQIVAVYIEQLICIFKSL